MCIVIRFGNILGETPNSEVRCETSILMSVVFSLAIHHPFRSFLGATIVHPAIGVHMVKSKDRREVIPGNAVMLKVMWQRATEANCGAAFCWSDCNACGKAIDNSASDVAARRGQRSQDLNLMGAVCPVCLLALHEGCREAVSIRDPSILQQRLGQGNTLGSRLPNIFQHLCPLCACLFRS